MQGRGWFGWCCRWMFAKQVSEFGKINWLDRDLGNLGGAEVLWRYTI
jgi:hypothetical protein